MVSFQKQTLLILGVVTITLLSLLWSYRLLESKTLRLDVHHNEWKSEPVPSPCKEGMITIERRYKHTMTCNAFDLTVRENHRHDRNFKLYVVYFVNCKIHGGYGAWMEEQLKYVPKDAFLKIVATSSECQKEKTLYENYQNILSDRNSTSATILECHDEADDKPTFEYYGIRAVWELGQINPDPNSIVFYFHSKGLTHWKTFDKYKQKEPFASSLTKITLGEVDRVLEAFNLFPNINKAGACGGQGWIWYNFWFARGSYLSRIEEPIITKMRHYYEHWLSRVDLPVQGVQPLNAIEIQRAMESCDHYNLIVDDNMVSWGLPLNKTKPPLSSNVFNVGTFWHPKSAWKPCNKSWF